MTFTDLFNNTLGQVQQPGVTQNAATQLNNSMVRNMNQPATIKKDDSDEYDRILRILDIFKKAYRLYAKDVIPSGRPDGRISQSVFREYEYIGNATTVPDWKETANPGYGPWADKFVFNKWEDEVMKILQDPKLRKVLANTKFVSQAEKDTDTEQKQKPGSGITLFTFIEELINGKGDFKDIRSKMMRKYFNVIEKEGDSGRSGSGGSKSSSPSSTNQTPTGKKIKAGWETIKATEKLEVGKFYQLKDYVWSNETNWSGTSPSSITFYVLEVQGDKVVMVAQRSSKDIKKLLDNTLGSNNYDYTSISGNDKTELILTGSNVSKMEIDNLKTKTLYMVNESKWFKQSAGGLSQADGNRVVDSLGTIRILVDKDTDTPIKINKKFAAFSGAPNILSEMINNIII